MNNSSDIIKNAIDLLKVLKTCLTYANFIFQKLVTNCSGLRDFVNTQSHLSGVQNNEDQTYLKTELGASET